MKRREHNLDKELRFHMEARLADLRASGLTDEEARRRIRQEFGAMEQVKDDCRDIRRTRWLSDLGKDLRFAARQMRRAPTFTAIAVLTLALGIGANSAIFTLVNAVLLKSLPVRDPGRLLLLGNIRNWGTVNGQTGSFSVFSYDLYNRLRQDSDVFEGLCGFQSQDLLVTVRGHGWSAAQPSSAKLVSGNYFGVLGVSAALGRPIAPPDDFPGAPPVAVVSYRYWSERLERDRGVVGSSLELSGVPVTVIGVAAPEFSGETLEPDPPSFWIPLNIERVINRQRTIIDSPDDHWLFVMGRLKPRVSRPQAEARLTSLLQNWMVSRDGSAAGRDAAAKSYIELTPGGSGITHMQRRYAETLRLLLGLSLLVLLIACANVANLLLARGTARTGEHSLRLALGARRGRLVRQSLTESLVLALAGGALGVAMAAAGTRALVALVFRGAEYVPIETEPDLRVIGFALALSMAAAIAFGLVPAIRSGRADLAPALKGVGRGAGTSGLSRRRFGLGHVIVVVQMALSVVLLAGAGLFSRSLANLTRQPLGFQREHVLIVNVDAGLGHYQFTQLGPLYQRLYDRLNSLPGVASASFSLYAPFTTCCWTSNVAVEGYVPKPKEPMYAYWNRVSARYFDALGTRILLGRGIEERDIGATHGVAVVTEEFARHYFGNANPIGRRFGFFGPQHRGDMEIVGVVENAKYSSPREDPLRMAFLPMLHVNPDPGESPQSAQFRSNFIRAIEIRSAGDPSAIAGEVRRALAEVDSNLTVLRTVTLDAQLAATLGQENVVAELGGFYGLLALVLAGIGLYGLMAYAVERRTGEIGIRMALGARRSTVVSMVIREVLGQGMAGIVLGIAAAIPATRLIAHQLYQVQPADPATLAAAAAMLLVSVTLAGYIPAFRASRIDPINALRHE